MIKKNNFFIKIYNKYYNFYFKKIHNIQIDNSENRDLVKENIKFLEHSMGLQTDWLLNLKKLYDLAKKNLDIENYHFMDVGCGNGVSLIYAYKKLNFKSYSGFDFIQKYVDITNKNISNSIGDNRIIAFNANASEYILDDKNYFIFMFNPFHGYILKKFIENNYANLVKNKSILAYSNYNQLDYVKVYFKNIQINKQYEIAICYF